MSGGTAERACHDLLVGLAGRLPDHLLWRLREWLAAGPPSRASIAAVLPRELLRHRVSITDGERDLLVGSAGTWGASPRLLDAVLPAHTPDAPACTFGPDPAPADRAALTALAVVRGYPGCAQLRLVKRVDGRREQRVVLVHGGERPWVLTGIVQRLLRVHGDRTPCVEVLACEGSPPPYHRAAIAASTPLWRAAEPVGARS